jgi:5-aminolevulinate synthase
MKLNALLSQLATFKKTCPFLARTPVASLRLLASLRASARRESGSVNPCRRPCPHRESALLATARKCPVMSRALSAHPSTPAPPLLDRTHRLGSVVGLTGDIGKADATKRFDYDEFMGRELDRKKRDGSYRYFNEINRLARSFPAGETGDGRPVTVWCSNDYLGMSSHAVVKSAMR